MKEYKVWWLSPHGLKHAIATGEYHRDKFIEIMSLAADRVFWTEV